MIIVRGASLGGSALDKKFGIPGLGINLTLRHLLQYMCKYSNLDAKLCTLINSSPEKACAKIVSYGEDWLVNKLAKVVTALVNRVAKNVSCSSNWKESLRHSISVTFTDDGIAVEVDAQNLAKDLFCQIGKKALTAALLPAIRSLARKLRSSCGGAQDHGSPSSSATPVGSSRDPDAPAGASTTTSKPTTKPTPTPMSTNKAIPQLVVYKPKTTSSSSVAVWVGGGLLAAGLTWLVVSRR